MLSRIKDTGHLLNIIDNVNENGLSSNTILVSFDIVNMFPSIDNERGLKALKYALDKRRKKKPSTSCLLEGFTLCLYTNNSVFNGSNLLQTNGTATGAPNSCSYSDLAIEPIDTSIFEERDKNFNELRYYGRFRDDCFVLWNGNTERLNDFHKFINSIDQICNFRWRLVVHR